MKFHSSTSGEIMMFTETARLMLGLLHKACDAKGVITLEQLPDAIAFIRAAVERDPGAPKDSAAASPELPIGFRQRAQPFLELLQRTQRKEGYVLWDAPSDFH